jgi:hypothetical protein
MIRKVAEVGTLFRAIGMICSLLLPFAGCDSDEDLRNRPPRIQPQADTAGVTGDTLWLAAHATDPDGDNLRFHLVIKVDWQDLGGANPVDAGLDPQTGQFWFRPDSDDMPKRGFVFRVEDTRGGKDSTEFDVLVR